jgi:uncharacterized SAM-binding protein YcdF (DUF218 family)
MSGHLEMNTNKESWHSSPWKRAVIPRRYILICLLLLLCIMALWLDHRQLLQSAARLWVEYDPVQPADAVAIFGGGIETRPLSAAEYFRQRLVPKILVSNVGSVVEHQSPHSHTERNLSELKKLGVPDDAVEIIGCNLSSTYQEVFALRRWSLSTGARSVMVPTEYFSARRVRWITQRVFQGTGVEVRVPVIASLDYLKGEWWNNADALLAFEREVIKYVGYRLVYGLLMPWYEPGNTSERCAN